MLSFDDALSAILENTAVLEPKWIKLKKLLGSVLAEPVIAPMDMPRFDNSAMDGFGVRVADMVQASESSPVQLTLQGTVQAGDSGEMALEGSSAIRILTGAPIPQGVDAVVMKEYCEVVDDAVICKTAVSEGQHIRRQGEEFRAEQPILPQGTRVTPPVLGLLATLGHAGFSVFRRPRVALIATGNELVKPANELDDGQIYESNSYALVGALHTLGITDVSVYRAKDTEEETQKVFSKALHKHDVVITLGGISVGDFDVVKDVVEAAGVTTVFWRLAMKPGKPVYFGTYTDENDEQPKWVFGLPGNPVSALVTFHQLVQPAVQKMMGLTASPTVLPTQAKLTQALQKKPGRQEYVRGILTSDNGEMRVAPTQGQDSHMLSGLSQANCLIVFPQDADTLGEGTQVAVESLTWSL